jgi:hypothetical protein
LGPTERKEQFDAVMRAQTLFEEMSSLVDRLDLAYSATAERARDLPETDAPGKRLRAFGERLDSLKKRIVATKEGGAITGEERIREHLDGVYGALLGWEGKPARYQVERIEALRRELEDVSSELGAVTSKELPALDEQLKRRKLEPIAPRLPDGPPAASTLN